MSATIVGKSSCPKAIHCGSKFGFHP
jgi:hypothetical protein